MKRVSSLIIAAVLAAGSAPRCVHAQQRAALSVAAAANLSFALDALDSEFRRTHPEVELTSATGSSGELVAQIEHGAPYDIFLSADLHFAQVLIKAGAGEPRSLSTFAIGRLVLWSTKAGLDVSDIAGVVRDPRVQRIAIANTTSAPFGRAAEEALMKLGVWAQAQPKLVVGESISQTTQFVETGNADAGFVALSVVLSPRLKDKGRWAEVPPALYSPLEQGAVITVHGTGNPAARVYLEFLLGPAARAILERFGYRLPAP